MGDPTDEGIDGFLPESDPPSPPSNVTPFDPTKRKRKPKPPPAGGYATWYKTLRFDNGRVIPDLANVLHVLREEPALTFAMAFDPFSIDDVATHAVVPADPTSGLKPYRFAYVASFTQSFVQMIDLDSSQPTSETFERVVFTLGQPTLPKGQ